MDIWWISDGFTNLLEIWWKSDGYLMDIWWISGGCMMDIWWIYKPNGNLMEIWWISDGYLMDIWWNRMDIWWKSNGDLMEIWREYDGWKLEHACTVGIALIESPRVRLRWMSVPAAALLASQFKKPAAALPSKQIKRELPITQVLRGPNKSWGSRQAVIGARARSPVHSHSHASWRTWSVIHVLVPDPTSHDPPQHYNGHRLVRLA